MNLSFRVAGIFRFIRRLGTSTDLLLSGQVFIFYVSPYITVFVLDVLHILHTTYHYTKVSQQTEGAHDSLHIFVSYRLTYTPATVASKADACILSRMISLMGMKALSMR